ncbi:MULTISPECIES: hypothetical protein [Micromonospora]|uniref:hypothetical protein n=1 Tax=Micromonospora TaxID=1873 RepID=UPI001585E849|nr:hypothetical protein [Micromonospora yangpuensis]
MSDLPSPGDVVRVTRRASVQFHEPITFRVIKVLTEYQTYFGWVWLRGYQLDDEGAAVATREIFVRPAELVPVQRRSPPPTTRAQRHRNMPRPRPRPKP